MNQQIKDFYENEWVHGDNDLGPRRVIYCDDVLTTINNCREISGYIKSIVRATTSEYMLIAYVFPDETTIYYYHDDDNDEQDVSYVFKATAILFSASIFGMRYAKFVNYKEPPNPFDSRSVAFKEDINCILDINKENFYLRVKEFKQNQIDKITNSIYNLKLLDLNLL